MLRNAKTLITAAAIGGLTLTAGLAMAGNDAQFKDLVGGDYMKAADTLGTRGFKSVDSNETPDGYYVVWWYHPTTGQCVNTQMKDNKLISADTGKVPQCEEAAKQAGAASLAAQASSSSEPSKKAKKACISKFGGKPTIKTVTALQPGNWEIILQGKRGKQVACTVNDSGKISDWVNM